MTSIIRKATQKDKKTLTQLLVSCAQSMSDQGMHHWLGVYDEQIVSLNLNSKQVFVLEVNKQIVGCIALGKEPASYYQDCWPDVSASDFYITQLAVWPEYQGLGYGKQLVQFCLDQIGDATVQLDAVDHYPALVKFYLELGFTIIASGIGLGDKRHLFIYKH